jgi:uncharacterized protein
VKGEGVAARIPGGVLLAGAVLCILGIGIFIGSLALGNPDRGAGFPVPVTWLMVAAGSALTILGGFALLLGLVLYVLVPSFSGQPRAARDYGSHRTVLASTALAVIIGNLLAVLYFIPALLLVPAGLLGGPDSSLGELLLSPLGIALAAVSLDVALLAVVYIRVVRPGVIPWERMGLHSQHLRSRLILGLLAGAVLFAASSVMELLLSRLGIQQTQLQLFQSIQAASVPEFMLVLLAGAVIAPVVEEIFFRGYVFRAYLDQKGLKQAFFFSAALFALIHLNIPAMIPIFVMGLLLAYFYYRTGSIIPSIVAHGVNNAAAFVLLYLGLA